MEGGGEGRQGREMDRQGRGQSYEGDLERERT